MTIDPRSAEAFAIRELRAGPVAAALLVPVLSRIAARRPSWTDGNDPASIVAESIPPADTETLRHGADWIASSLVSDAPWLSRLDRNGEPVKLAKIVALPQLLKEADKASRRFASRMASAAPTAGGEEAHAELGEGWLVVRLTTPEALDRESGDMGHCIGEGSYDARLVDGRHLYLSLRDPSGRPHATFEIDLVRDAALQIQGKQNRPPERRYALRMKDWLGTVSWLRDADALRMGLVRDVDGRLHDLVSLPDRLEIPGSLVLENVPKDGSVRLPAELLVVGGELSISGESRVLPIAMPRKIDAKGAVRISGRPVFPDGSEISARRLTFKDCGIVRMPESIVCEEEVWFEKSALGFGCREVSSRTSSVHFADCSARALPDRIAASGLHVSGTRLRALPSELLVADLHLSGTGIRSLEGMPGTLASLTLREPGLEAVPSCVVRRGVSIFEASADLSLPASWSVGSLSIKGPGPSALPEGLHVEVDMDVSRAAGIRDVPDGLRVGGSLVLGAGVAAIGRNVEVGGHLFVRSPVLASIGEGLEVQGDLRLDPGCPLESLPAGAWIGCALDVPDAIAALPAGLTVGTLDLSATGSNLRALPAGLTVLSLLRLDGSNVGVLPDDLVVEGELRLPDGITSHGLPPGVNRDRVVPFDDGDPYDPDVARGQSSI